MSAAIDCLNKYRDRLERQLKSDQHMLKNQCHFDGYKYNLEKAISENTTALNEVIEAIVIIEKTGG